MRFIPTFDPLVEALKKKAKQQQRKSGGKHADLLNRVARSAGYDHWHHVVQCNKLTTGKRGAEALLAECVAIQEAELRGEVKIVMTGPEVGIGPFVLFSTGIGDAWMLAPEEGGAACLVWRSEARPPRITETTRHIEIGWDGRYELLGAFMHVVTEAEGIGARAVAGYPLDGIRSLIDRALSFERKFAAVIEQEDALEMTEEVIAQVVRLGWEEAKVREFAAQGYRYSPSRNTMLGPVMTSDDDLDELTP
ncbi:hypothetical protein QTI33_32080 [Variovorax sp. J22P271]|uniref:hypothetical protein n=1 Tax=Variovorax davisae TaxID=3053515 RepID=UPI002576E0EE|nr:hypothetical protein [Variovorax sp. J22P271]MDM0036812.1 hypothetical protein [Variovorax sp. J22P271]